MITTRFTMPSWRQGIIKRLRRIGKRELLDAALAALLLLMLVFMTTVSVLFAFYAPVTLEVAGW
ncbi:MAG: hypothetical protein ACOYYI_09655 [Chloroflexota bacterium]